MGFDSLRKDKILFLLIHNCECIVSTQSVKIALIFHNGFFEVRFLVMEHVFYFFFRQFPMWFARIALVFHNGFCRVRFPIMEQVFFHVSSPALLRNATGGGFCQEENATNTRFLFF